MKKSKKKVKKPLAKYICCSCKFEYESTPGPTACPMCHNVYVLWVNYDEHWSDLVGFDRKIEKVH